MKMSFLDFLEENLPNELKLVWRTSGPHPKVGVIEYAWIERRVPLPLSLFRDPDMIASLDPDQGYAVLVVKNSGYTEFFKAISSQYHRYGGEKISVEEVN